MATTEAQRPQQAVMVYFPRGFRIAVPTDHAMLACCGSDRRGRSYFHAGDADVIELYRRYRCMGKGNEFANWDTIDYTIRTVNHLIPSINGFFYLQAENAFLDDHAFQFLYAIRDNIQAGVSIDPMMNMELMDDPAQYRMSVKRQPPVLPKSPHEAYAMSPWLRRWLEQPGSLEDIVCTCFVLFGPARGQGL